MEEQGRQRVGWLDDLPSQLSTIQLVSTGAASDEFVRQLDLGYGTGLTLVPMRKRVQFTALSMDGTPDNLTASKTNFKLFHDQGRDEDYAEFFLNIDLPNRTVEFAEKDAEYRPATIKALSIRTQTKRNATPSQASNSKK